MGYCYTRDAALFILADGMGGHANGEVAAQMALQSMSVQFQADARRAIARPNEFLADALVNAHLQILRLAADRGLPDTPRTTLVAVLVKDGYATWVHCGDSRLYLIRDQKLVTRTRDHSYLEQGRHLLVGRPEINRNVLYTCLGSPSRPVFDVSPSTRLRQGDRFLLCSDGLWGNLEDDEIVSAMADCRRPLSDLVPALVDKAIARGGPTCDNTTVIAISWDMPAAEGPEVVTDSILEDVFASTIQAPGWLDSGLSPDGNAELNDDDIERSIAEINAAISKMPPLTRK